MEGHGIRYENAAVHWTEALPLGNGTFGAMAYLQDAHMRLSMNHYEVYFACPARTGWAFTDRIGCRESVESAYDYL